MRLYVTGAPGSGKTTAAKKLSIHYAVPFYSLDEVVWCNARGFKNQRFPAAVRDEAVLRVATQEAWIAEGTYFQEWLQPLFQRAHAVLILAPPRSNRSLRLLKRHLFGSSWHLDPRDNLGLLFSNLRWGFGYETTAMLALEERLRSTGVPFVAHKGGDLFPVVGRLRERVGLD